MILRSRSRRAIFAAAVLTLLSGVSAWAQRTPAYQDGMVSANDALKAITGGRYGKAGGISGDGNGLGMNPTSITDSNGIAQCAHSAAVGGTLGVNYHSFCFGHNSVGSPIWKVDGIDYAFNGVLGGATGLTTQTLGHTFWSGPLVGQNRFTDRVFIGAAVKDTGFNTFPQLDYFSQLRGGVLGGGDTAQAYILGDIDAVAGSPPNTAVPHQALVVANSSLHSVSTGAFTYSTPRGLDALFVNNPLLDATGGGPRVPGWAILIQSYRYTAFAGQTYGIEDEIANFASLVTGWTPDTATGYGSIALELGCGGGLSSAGQFRCTVAMYVAANPMQFGAGILFFPGSLAADGPAGTISAMMMPYNYQIQWFNAGLMAQIFGNNTGDLNIITGSGRLIVSSLIRSTANNAVLDAPTSYVSGLAVNGTMGVNYNGSNFLPNSDNTVTLGTGSNRWSTIYGVTASVTNLIVTQASPAATDACTAGQIVTNTGFIAACTASGAWKHVAIATY